MKALAATVNWNYSIANFPDLYVLVDEFPKDMRFEQRGNLYFAEKDGYVRFFSYKGPDRGFAGRHFDIVLCDGTPKTLIGPWSSSSAAMNAAGFTLSIPVTMTTEREVWQQGHTFYACHATVEWVEKVLAEFCPYAELREFSIGVFDSTLSEDQCHFVGGGQGAPMWAVAPVGVEAAKPPLPPTDDIRWIDRCRRRVVIGGLKGSELYAGLCRESDLERQAEKAKAWGRDRYAQKRRDGYVYRFHENRFLYKEARTFADLYAKYALDIERWWRDESLGE